MVTAVERIAHYKNRMVSSQIDPVLAAMNSQQVANFAAYAIDWVARQTAVHQYLDSEGVNPTEYFNYNAFAGEIYHIYMHFDGAAAIAGAADFVIKYTGMGCTAIRLKAIAALFQIVVP